MLWFPAPPVDIPRPRGPECSLAYLAYLARKRKNKGADDVMDVDNNSGGETVNKRHKAQPTVTEQMESLLAA